MQNARVDRRWIPLTGMMLILLGLIFGPLGRSPVVVCAIVIAMMLLVIVLLANRRR